MGPIIALLCWGFSIMKWSHESGVEKEGTVTWMEDQRECDYWEKERCCLHACKEPFKDAPLCGSLNVFGLHNLEKETLLGGVTLLE